MTDPTRTLSAQPLTAAAFAPFGDVIERAGRESFPINLGKCDRFHDLARTETVGEGGRIGVSIGYGRPYPIPLTLTLVERHPLGSQAWMPLNDDPFLVIVAPDEGGAPGRPLAFLTAPGQGVNYLRDTWHGVVTPFVRETSFLIVDRIGPGDNLVEYTYAEPWTVLVS